MTPRLSVIIPVRNGVEFVGRAIASAQAIPATPLEILLIDDGSTDGTDDLLASAAAADERIVIIRRDRDHRTNWMRTSGSRARTCSTPCWSGLCPKTRLFERWRSSSRQTERQNRSLPGRRLPTPAL
jgi:cellulose synthase/poly-beta-1,6-N-acetylglucosamine synthase-like glycosyltransferase